jgi:DnaJ family protein C protein 28
VDSRLSLIFPQGNTHACGQIQASEVSLYKVRSVSGELFSAVSRVSGWERKVQEPVKDPYPLSTEEEEGSSNLILTSGTPAASKSEKARNPWDYDIRPPKNFIGRRALDAPVSPRVSSSAKAPLHQRLSTAREASVDYSIGDRNRAKTKVTRPSEGRRPMPQSIRAFAGLVEDKIERARRKGAFDNLPGRGKPFDRDINESNPFIDRTEKLMNRIVQRQGAAPPWVELQRGLCLRPGPYLPPFHSRSLPYIEVEAELSTFRTRIRESWLRRSSRMLSLQVLTPSFVRDAPSYRDQDWESRERCVLAQPRLLFDLMLIFGIPENKNRPYHTVAIKAVNENIRRYNVLAPFSVRRAVLHLESELEACFADVGPKLQAELEHQMRQGTSGPPTTPTSGLRMERRGSETAEEVGAVDESMWKAFKRLVSELVEERRKRGSVESDR